MARFGHGITTQVIDTKQARKKEGYVFVVAKEFDTNIRFLGDELQENPLPYKVTL